MDKRKIYQEKAQAKLDELDARINLLKAQAKNEAADAKVGANEQLPEMGTLRKNLEARLSQLGDAGENAIEELGKGVEHAMSDIEEALKNADKELHKTQ
ncbi:MAG: hypothetical protein WD740_04450 [Anaerolineales bacterium]